MLLKANVAFCRLSCSACEETNSKTHRKSMGLVIVSDVRVMREHCHFPDEAYLPNPTIIISCVFFKIFVILCMDYAIRERSGSMRQL